MAWIRHLQSLSPLLRPATIIDLPFIYKLIVSGSSAKKRVFNRNYSTFVGKFRLLKSLLEDIAGLNLNGTETERVNFVVFEGEKGEKIGFAALFDSFSEHAKQLGERNIVFCALARDYIGVGLGHKMVSAILAQCPVSMFVSSHCNSNAQEMAAVLSKLGFQLSAQTEPAAQGELVVGYYTLDRNNEAAALCKFAA